MINAASRGGCGPSGRTSRPSSRSSRRYHWNGSTRVWCCTLEWTALPLIQGARLDENRWVPLAPLVRNYETGAAREPMEAQWAFGLEIRFFHRANDYPFIKARLYRQKAENDRSTRGDLLSAIISLNTAVEIMLFDTYRLMVIDQCAQTEKEVIDQARATTFSALVRTTLPRLLGGNW